MNERIKYIVAVFCFLTLVSSGALAGEVTGTITFDGEVPAMKELQMTADPECEKKHSTPPVSDALVLGDNRTMANVFVRVKSGLPEKQYPTPTEPVIIKQHGCIYTPHVVGAMIGQPVKFLNEDGILHNVHALPEKNKPFNLGMPATMKEAQKEFLKEEWMFPIKCDVHPWMKAYAAVMPHPFFDVTEKDGKFTIKGLDAGTYEIEIWHEKLGTKIEKVTVGQGDTKTVDFKMSRSS